MDDQKLKTILKDLKSVVNALESELDSDVCSDLDYEKIYPYITDYDEVFMDEE
tara:strand:+ start:291 stop:449 length:159 start_codon:yes stop_codon:yes gene_type:complete